MLVHVSYTVYADAVYHTLYHTLYTLYILFYVTHYIIPIITTSLVIIIDGVCGDDGDQGLELRPQQPHQGDLVSGTVRRTEIDYIMCFTIQCTTLHVMCIHMFTTENSFILFMYAFDG